MAKQLSDKELASIEFSAAGNRSKYDWDQWFNGKAWSLVKGEEGDEEADYTLETATFRLSVVDAAHRRGLNVRIATTDDGCVIQAYEATEAEKAKWKANYAKWNASYALNAKHKKAAKEAGVTLDEYRQGLAEEHGFGTYEEYAAAAETESNDGEIDSEIIEEPAPAPKKNGKRGK